MQRLPHVDAHFPGDLVVLDGQQVASLGNAKIGECKSGGDDGSKYSKARHFLKKVGL